MLGLEIQAHVTPAAEGEQVIEVVTPRVLALVRHRQQDLDPVGLPWRGPIICVELIARDGFALSIEPDELGQLGDVETPEPIVSEHGLVLRYTATFAGLRWSVVVTPNQSCDFSRCIELLGTIERARPHRPLENGRSKLGPIVGVLFSDVRIERHGDTISWRVGNTSPE
jgi:hypothetical protein